MKRIGISSLLLLGAVFTASAGSVYKWTDKDGRMHYSDTPVFNAQKVGEKPGVTTSAETETVGSDRARRETECKNMQSQLDVYNNAVRLIETDNLGHEKEYTAEDRKKLIDLTQQKVKTACSNIPQAAPAASAPADTPSEPGAVR